MIKRILIVDDQFSILSGLSKALIKYCSYHGEIRAVENGTKALGEIRSSFYDVCFLDMNLPDISGLDIMDSIHKLSPETKVVIMTADYLDDDIKKKIDEGAIMFVPKPIELDVIKAFINKESDGDGHAGNGNANYGDGHINDGGDGHAADNNATGKFIENRRLERKPAMGAFRYSLSVFYDWELKSDIEGAMIDFSAEGVGIKTSYPLYPGNVLRFDNSLDNRSGIVKWSSRSGRTCRAGIKFI